MAEMKWTKVEDGLPEYSTRENRWFLCITEHHLDDAPMMYQYDEDTHEFGLWSEISFGWDVPGGYIESNFESVEEIGLEKVVAWMEIQPYEHDEDDEEV